MARELHGVEKGFRISAENSDTLNADILFGTAAPGADGDDQDAAAVGSLYLRQNGASSQLYIKIGTANALADWDAFSNTTIDELSWRNETVRAATNDTLTAGAAQDPTGWSDNESGVDATSWNVGDYVVGDYDGTPALWEITAKVSGTSITLAAAGQAIAANDTFVVQSFLPDSPGSQELQAIIHSPNGTSFVKISDLNWDFADGINLPAGYSAVNGTLSSSDTVNSAIEKLDGNQQDIQTSSGIAQGAVNYGTFTGDIIPDSSTNKASLQSLETELVDTRQNVDDLITLSGSAENATNNGTFTGDSLADSQTNKALFQRIETLLEQMRGVQSTGITTIIAVDSVPHASVKAIKWMVEVFEEATPANRKAFEIYALTDGTNVDDTTYAKLKLGAAFNLTLGVAISGANMVLNVTSTTGGVTATVRRVEVVKSVL